MMKNTLTVVGGRWINIGFGLMFLFIALYDLVNRVDLDFLELFSVEIMDVFVHLPHGLP